MAKRNLFIEMTEGFEALAEERAGKRTLRTHEFAYQPAHSRKLGTGEGKTECPSGLVNPLG